MNNLGYVYSCSDTFIVESVHIISSILTALKYASNHMELCGVFVDLASEIYPFIKIDKSEINTITNQGLYRITTAITIENILKKDGKPNRNIKLDKRVIKLFVNCAIVHN